MRLKSFPFFYTLIKTEIITFIYKNTKDVLGGKVMNAVLTTKAVSNTTEEIASKLWELLLLGENNENAKGSIENIKESLAIKTKND